MIYPKVLKIRSNDNILKCEDPMSTGMAILPVMLAQLYPWLY